LFPTTATALAPVPSPYILISGGKQVGYIDPVFGISSWEIGVFTRFAQSLKIGDPPP